VKIRSLNLLAILVLVAGLLPAGIAEVRAASPSLVDPDPNNYAIVIQGGSSGLDPEHPYVCDLDPEHTSSCGVYGQYGYPPRYLYPPRYSYPPQYAAYPPDYVTPPTLPESTIACTTVPSGAAVVVGAQLSCTAVNSYFSSTDNDGSVSVSGVASISSGPTASGSTISFGVNLNTAGSAQIVVTYTADTSGSVETHAAATHYLDTINGSTTVNGSAITETGSFSVTGDSVSITGLDPMQVWLAGDTLGEDTITVTSGSRDAISLTLSGCSTASGSDVSTATVASGGTQVVYGRVAGTCSVTGTANGASATVTAAVTKRTPTSPVSNTDSTGSPFGGPSNTMFNPSFTTTHYVDQTVDSSVDATVAGATVSYALVSASSTAGLCSLNTTTGSLTFNLGVISGSTTGVCTVRATQAATAAYDGWTQDATRAAVLKTSLLNNSTLSRDPASGTIVAGESVTVSYAGTTYGLLSWQTSGPCYTLSSGPSALVYATAAGSCSIALSDGGSNIYKAVTSATLNISTSDASQTISFSPLPTGKFVGDASFSLTASTTSGLTVSFASDSPSICTVAGSTVTIVAAGTCSITASQAGGTSGTVTYAAASPVTRTTAIDTKSQTISFSSLPTGKLVGDAPFSLTASATSELTVSFVSTTTGACTVSGSTVTIVAAGTCSITASQAGGIAGDGYTYAAASSVIRSTTILKGTQATPTLAADSVGPYTPGSSIGLTVSGGDARGAFSWSASGTCSVSSGSSNASTGVGTLSLSLNNGGSCSVTASYAGDDDWEPVSSNTLILTVSGYSQTISFTQPTSPMSVGMSASLSASSIDSVSDSASGLTVAFARSASTTPSGACSVSGTTVSYEAPGTCYITASQAGGTGTGGKVYGAALSVTRSVTVEAATQTITLQLGATWTGDDETLGSTASIDATASSGLPVSATSATSAVCTISGASPWTVRFIGIGECRISFTRAGGTVEGLEYLAADPVTASTTVATITTPSVGSPNATFSFSASATNGGASKVQLTSPTILGDGGAYRSADGSTTFRIGCGANPAAYLDALEITRTLYIDGIAQGSVSETVGCAASTPYSLSGLSNGRYVFTAKAVTGAVKSPAATVATVEVGAAPVVNFATIAGAISDTTNPGVRYLKVSTPTLYWSVVSGTMTGQTLVRYSAAATAEGACPTGAAPGAASSGAGWSLDTSFSTSADPATLAAGTRSQGFAGAELPERCIQFAHIGVNGLFSATSWSSVYLVDKTRPSITPSIAGMLNGIAQSCVIVTVQACRIEPGSATISVTGSDPSTSSGSGSGVSRIRMRGSDFDTSLRPYATIANRSRPFTLGSSQTTVTIYVTLTDRATNSITVPVSFSVAAESEPVFNAVVDLVDCANPTTVIRPDFAEQGFLYWPVGSELCLVPRVDMAVKGLRYVNGVAQESAFVGTLTAKLTGSAASANDLELASIGKWPTDKINDGITFYGSIPDSLSSARTMYESSAILYKQIAAGTATAEQQATYAAAVLRFRIDAETSVDNADSVPYVSIPFEFSYVYGWVERGTTTPLEDYRVETAAITLKVVAVNLGAGE